MTDGELVTIEIDGAAAQVPAGSTILEAAREAGVAIPTLCAHKALSPYGACRVCVVEIIDRGRAVLRTACNTLAQDGMTVSTGSENVLKTRRVIVELLLTRAPDSPEIQELAEELGVTSSRFVPRNDKCIMCGLCVRMCEERMGRSAISFAGRGMERTVTSPFDETSSVCQTCGACVSVCPTGAVNLESVTTSKLRPLMSAFDADLAPRGAIYRPYPQAVPNWPVIDKKRCVHLLTGECQICSDVCEAKAIDYEQQDEETQVEVGAIVVTPGFDEFLAREQYDFGYSQYPDVVSSMEFERILSASGPYGGHVQRPSDGRTPKRIAFLQCVGSRDLSCRNRYCSSVCCMYAIKEAVIAKEHMGGELDVTIFFMDMRAFGKDFDKYYERAKAEYGVNFVRARVSDVSRVNGDGQLTLRYSPASAAIAEDQFDLVVLSVGLEPTAELGKLAARLGVRQNPYGFIWTDPKLPVGTSRPGVYVAGVANGPKDIPETVVQASAAACQAGRLLAEARNTLTVAPEYPPERDVSSEPPRIGAFICHCGINIGGVVDVPSVVEYARTLPNVLYAEHNLYTCSQDTQEHIREVIEEHKLNRVIVASCSPRTHEPLFQQTLRTAGLNTGLFCMANIRDQCSWTHMREPEAATTKARDLVRMVIAKARLAQPLSASTIPVINKALVIGGGWAGMNAALAIADQGYDVTLVEKTEELGGNMRNIRVGFGGQDVPAMLADMIEKITNHPRIRVLTGRTVAEVSGFVGNFKSALDDGAEFEFGVCVLATGASEYEPTEHLYGDARVVTQLQLQESLAGDEMPWDTPPKRVVMIQCVGSRNEDHPYCSRVCCTRAVRNAARIKELSPSTEVHVLYRDMRTYGLHEEAYGRARDLGVSFIQFDPECEPRVEGGESLTVTVAEPLLGADLRLETDLLVLSTGIVANADENDVLGKLFKVPVNDDGFFLEAHAKLRPVEFATEGVFLAGLAHGPKSLDESHGQALAAASRACTILQLDEIEAQTTIAEVRAERCVACGLCEAVCAYGAVALEQQHFGREERLFAKVNPALCKGCGACVAGCRSGALNLRGFTDQQILAEILEL